MIQDGIEYGMMRAFGGHTAAAADDPSGGPR